MEIAKKTLLIIAFIFVSSSLISIISADADIGPSPLFPNHFKGNIIIDNNNAPIGTEIKIYVSDTLENTIKTTIIGKYDLSVTTGNSGDEIKFYVNNTLATTYERKEKWEAIDLNLQVWTDRDNDGIVDNSDKLIGNKLNVNNNFNNLSVAIDNNETLTGAFSGTKTVKFIDDNKEIINFNFDFSNNILNLFNIEIKKQSNDEGSIIIKGMPSGIVKTVYIDKLKQDTNSVCIKDEEISSITEISTNCDDSSETKLNCPGTNGNYICSVEESRFKISGLSHSGVKEFYIAPAASPAPAGGGGGGGGSSGGGSSVTTKTNINQTSENTNTTININYENNEAENEKQNQQTGITGDVVGFAKTKRGMISLAFIGLVFVVGFFILIRNKHRNY